MTDKNNHAEREQIRADIVSGKDTGKEISIESPSISQIPTNEEILGQEPDPFLEAYVDLVRKFLETPIIEDHFAADDKARDAWEAGVYEKYGDVGAKIIADNKLRLNKLSLIYSSLPELADIAGGEKGKQITAIYQALDSRPKQEQGIYKKLPNSEKRAITNQFTLAGLTALQILAGRDIPLSSLDYINGGYLPTGSE